MNDYWQIISLINEILTIYECETFKIDYIKAELKHDGSLQHFAKDNPAYKLISFIQRLAAENKD